MSHKNVPRVIHGSSWYCDSQYAHDAKSRGWYPQYYDDALGFRLVNAP